MFEPTDENNLLSAIEQLDEHVFSYDISKYVSWKNSAKVVLNGFTNKENQK